MTFDHRGTLSGLPRGAGLAATAGVRLVLLPSGALHWAEEGVLCVSDLHLGKTERTARLGGALLPPYEVRDTLDRLTAEIAATEPATVVCLGDSFDDPAAARAVAPEAAERLEGLARGRRWIWIAGNHDPAPSGLAGETRGDWSRGPLVFRHIAACAGPEPGQAEVSGHYHPKARLSHRGRRIVRPCFLGDGRRLILPAFGTYTGGLDAADPAFCRLLGPGAKAWLTGPQVVAVPRAALLA